MRIRRLGRGVLLEPIETDAQRWFAELDRFGPEPLLAEGRNQPATPTRALFP